MAFQTTTLSTTYDLSANGSLKVGGEELAGFQSGTITIEGSSVEFSVRGSGGWTQSAPGKRSAGCEVTFLKLGTNAAQVGIRELSVDPDYQNKGVEIVYRSESATVSAGTGYKGIFVLDKYTEEQDGGEGGPVKCTASFKGYGALTKDNATSGGGSGGGSGSGET